MISQLLASVGMIELEYVGLTLLLEVQDSFSG